MHMAEIEGNRMKTSSAQPAVKSKARKQNLSLLIFTLPALIVYAVFKLYPAIFGIYYAMTDWNGVNKSGSFVGLSNFARALQDTYFWQSILFTFKYVAVMVIVANIIALTLAVAIESRKHARGVFRTVFYLPNMISMVIGGYMWMLSSPKCFTISQTTITAFRF